MTRTSGRSKASSSDPSRSPPGPRPRPMRRFDIPPIDSAAVEAAAERQRTLTKPPGSLGRLEGIACRLAGIQGSVIPAVENKWIIVAAADHGVTRDSVSAYPQEVTAQMVLNFLSGGAAINVLARPLRGTAYGGGCRYKRPRSQRWRFPFSRE